MIEYRFEIHRTFGDCDATQLVSCSHWYEDEREMRADGELALAGRGAKHYLVVVSRGVLCND